MPEISEEELTRLRNAENVVRSILSNDEAAVLAERALKMVNPNAQTPRLDRHAKQNEPIDKLQKEINDLKNEIAERDRKAENDAKLNQVASTWDSGIAELRRDGWTDQGIEALKDIRDKKGLLDPMDCATIYLRDHPPSTPATPGGGSGPWNFMEAPAADANKDIDVLIQGKGDGPILDKLIADAQRDFKQSQQPATGLRRY